jgi:hypothetical protein
MRCYKEEGEKLKGWKEGERIEFPSFGTTKKGEGKKPTLGPTQKTFPPKCQIKQNIFIILSFHFLLYQTTKIIP